MDRGALGRRRARRQHGRRHLVERRCSTARPGVGPVRSNAAAAASRTDRRADADDLARRHHQRVVEHDRVVDDQAGRHEHQPAPAELVPAAGEQPAMPATATTVRDGGQRPTPGRPRPAARRSPPPTQTSPRHDGRQRGSRAAGAGRSGARRRRPTPARRRARSRPRRRARRRRPPGRPAPARSPAGAPATAATPATTTATGHDGCAPPSASPGPARRGRRRRRAQPAHAPTVATTCTGIAARRDGVADGPTADDGDGQPRQPGRPTA